jgi:hypothetical protein
MEPADGPQLPRGRRRRRAIWIALGAVAIVLIAGAVSAAQTYGHLTQGRGAMAAGRSDLVAGNAAAAQGEFADAQTDFRAAVSAANAPWLRAIGLVPVAGRTPDAIAAIADAGLQTARAGTAIADALATLPDGLASLAPAGGRVPLERIDALAGPVSQADALTSDALLGLERSAGHLVLAPVADARAEALDTLRDLREQLAAGARVLEGLPAFLGADGARVYFFGAVNPAELRGAGGLLGAYSILTVQDGRFTFGRFSPTQQLPRLNVADLPGTTADYSDNYDHYRTGDGFWLNANMTPDFPSFAATMAEAYEAATGRHVDGVITADPFALQALLTSTGPTLIPGLDVRVSADDVVAFVTNEAYRQLRDPGQRKQVLGAVAASVVDRFLARPDPSLFALKNLAATASAGHIQLWSADPGLQSGLVTTGVGGAFAPPAGDLLAVVQNNASATKLDFFQHRTVAYDVRLGDGGAATADLAVGLENASPTTGYPPYVIGPYPGLTSVAGENIAILQVYCGEGCGVDRATVDGEPIDTGLHTELGHPYLATYQRIAPGATSELRERLTLPEAWQGNSSGGTYRLHLAVQPTINADRVRVSVALPPGMHATEMSPELDLDGTSVVYEGSPDADLDLWVRFRPGLPGRLWRDLTRFMSTPV